MGSVAHGGDPVQRFGVFVGPAIEHFNRLDEKRAQRGQAIFDAGGHDLLNVAGDEARVFEFAQCLRHHFFGKGGDAALQASRPRCAAKLVQGVEDHGGPFPAEQPQDASRGAVFGKGRASIVFGKCCHGVGTYRYPGHETVPSGREVCKASH